MQMKIWVVDEMTTNQKMYYLYLKAIKKTPANRYNHHPSATKIALFKDLYYAQVDIWT